MKENLCPGCGSPIPHVRLCDRCKDTIGQGRLILLEVVNKTVPENHNVICTGYRIVIDPARFKGSLQPGVAAVYAGDLKKFLGNFYKIKINGLNRDTTGSTTKGIFESRTTGRARRICRIQP